MKAYSTDLRERVIAARQEGKTQDRIAATYWVSTGSIKHPIRRYKATGSVAATIQRRQEPRISRGYEGALRALVTREPLARLDWYGAAWEHETGIVASIQAMSRMLVRLGLRQENDDRRA